MNKSLPANIIDIIFGGPPAIALLGLEDIEKLSFWRELELRGESGYGTSFRR